MSERSEVEREAKLKTCFGVSFLVLTVIFTVASYSIVVLNQKLALGVSNEVLLALVVETPIQWVGLLYVIAKNLFPHDELKQKRLLDKQRGKQEK
ncbi:MAG: hypothetical protein A2150_04000 [Candidatus Muproteobacteria bacterium RBG_16_64_11]|uniref:Uncharacterized protein n=1 Tax=Candidatus Muproteobacteria bacterium RBG_16_64_11 TaxID=1817758 RepID=A0A1F6TCV6_9PROT|nr:MAG: hypothetical protein A2150_04000 [Candidatus Muproteobacteria bacterium RBG_16_64_11]